jgi:hypothetical protein
MRSEQSDEQSAEQLQEVKHPKARIAHRGICAGPATIFGSHTLKAASRPDRRLPEPSWQGLKGVGDSIFVFVLAFHELCARVAAVKDGIVTKIVPSLRARLDRLEKSGRRVLRAVAALQWWPAQAMNSWIGANGRPPHVRP